MNELIHISNVSKIYGEQAFRTVALDNISLSVASQSFTVITGRSGSGKTTLLNTIGGLEPPTLGEITVNGQNPYRLDDSRQSAFRRQQIGHIFQFFNLLPELTVYENICVPSCISRRAPDEFFLKQITDQLGLTDILEKYPAELSGGQQQLVAAARALSTSPGIILADEPTGNLDKRSGEELVDLLCFSCRLFGQTLILATHDLETARLADRILTLEDGHILSDISGGAYDKS